MRPIRKVRYQDEAGNYVVVCRCSGCGESMRLHVPEGDSYHLCEHCQTILECRIDVIDGSAFFQSQMMPGQTMPKREWITLDDFIREGTA